MNSLQRMAHFASVLVSDMCACQRALGIILKATPSVVTARHSMIISTKCTRVVAVVYFTVGFFS